MGSFILRGITTALLVTVLTLFGGIIWDTMGLGGLSVSKLLDIGLLASCLVGGYRTAKESGVWFMGGVTGAGYVIVGTLLLALFLPIRGWGFVQILGEGALIGLVAGAFGAGTKGTVTRAGAARTSQSFFRPSYVGYDTNDYASGEFDWNNEGGLPKDDSLEIKRAKRNSEDDSDIEWPWDREDKNKKSKDEDIESSGVPERWEAKALENDHMKWERADKAGIIMANTEKVSSEKGGSKNIDLRPWWE